MQKVFEKTLESLEEGLELADKEKERCVEESHLQFDSAKGYANGVAIAIEIVKQEAEMYNNGWIPCSERMPELFENVLISTKQGGRAIGHRYSNCAYGRYYDLHESAVDEVIAWQPFPAPYRPKGELEV